MDWPKILDWIYSFGEAYGVNPLIFAFLYFGTIPFSLLSFRWMYKKAKRGEAIFFPIFSAFLCFIGTYVYLFIAGKNIPGWVYLLIILMMGYSGYYLWKKIKRLKA